MFDPSEVKLPAQKPDGSRTTKHPLVWALADAYDLGFTLADIARKMNVTPQTLHIWKTHALKNRNFLLPAAQIKALSEATGVAPYYFRPDLWPNPTWRF